MHARDSACTQLWRDACMAECPTQQRDRCRVHRREQTGRQHRAGTRHKYSAASHRDSPRIASPSEAHRTIGDAALASPTLPVPVRIWQGSREPIVTARMWQGCGASSVETGASHVSVRNGSVTLPSITLPGKREPVLLRSNQLSRIFLYPGATVATSAQVDGS